jgi:tRNA (adenine-N(1)-)-methyltransferase non-catalytic subunit
MSNWILIRDNTGHEMIINIKKERKLRWRRHFTLPLSDITENDLPAYYKLDDRGSLQKATDDILADELKNLNWGTEVDESRTNANIMQSMQAQKLTITQIEEMKKANVGKDIIDDLIKNNENFELRTDFSKEKYIKKKKMKYDVSFKAEKCSLQTVFRHIQKMMPKDMM